ncbi:MAG: flagellar basal body P-ring formation chaperone FlgA, partial [Cyanobacteria bacterium J06648_11]
TLRIFSWARRNETVEPKVFGRRLHTKNHAKVKATPQGAQYRQTSDEKADTVVRSLMAEKPTQDERDLRRRYLVKRGDTVRVKLQVGSLEVSLTGCALTNAARGESVRIRNERNRRVVDAVVTESGEAVVLDL